MCCLVACHGRNNLPIACGCVVGLRYQEINNLPVACGCVVWLRVMGEITYPLPASALSSGSVVREITYPLLVGVLLGCGVALWSGGVSLGILSLLKQI